MATSMVCKIVRTPVAVGHYLDTVKVMTNHNIWTEEIEASLRDR